MTQYAIYFHQQWVGDHDMEWFLTLSVVFAFALCLALHPRIIGDDHSLFWEGVAGWS